MSRIPPRLDMLAYAKRLLPTQFRNKTTWTKWLTVITRPFQEIEDAFQDLMLLRYLSSAAAADLDDVLDACGEILGLKRKGLSNADYYVRLKARIIILHSSGTWPQIRRVLAAVLTRSYKYTPRYPAAFEVKVTEATTTAQAEELASLTALAKAAGVGAGVIYNEDTESNTFSFSDDDTEPTSTTQGFNGVGGDPVWESADNSVDNRWVAAAYSPTLGSGSGRIVAISDSTGTNQVQTSDDGGDTWTPRNAASARAWEDVVWAPSLALFVAVASDGTLGGRCMTSPDGITWTSRTMPDGTWSSIAWNASLARFVAVGRSAGPNYACTSTNGTSWTTTSVTQIGGYWESVTAAGAYGFVAIGQFDTGNGQAMYSTTGLNWSTSGVSVPEANQWTSVAYSPDLSRLVAVSKDGTNQVMSSDDGGVTWTARAEAAANQWLAVCWSDSFDRFIAVSQDGTNRIMMSASGTASWSATAAPATKEWAAIVDCALIGRTVSLALADTTDGVMRTSAAENTDTGGKFADVASVA